ncbi:MAG: desulfoferrodoxin [Phycisphaerae bacterium]|jgi:superoxide reductase
MATKIQETYICSVCNMVVEVQFGAFGKLVCCGQPMELTEGKTADKTTEKHVPIIEKIDGGYKVTVGSTIHPMTDEHYIAMIELVADGLSYIKYLQPGDEPVAEFKVEAENVTAREFCNVHGLWKA